MKTLTIFLLLALLGCSLAQSSEDVVFEEVAPSPVELGTSILSSLLTSEPVQRKLQKVYDLVDLKVRLFQLVKSLLTRENFILVRRLLEQVVHVCNFFIELLPDRDGTENSLLQYFFPLLQFNQLAEVTSATAAPNHVERISREVNETSEDQELLKNHRQQVLDVAKLIYSTP